MNDDRALDPPSSSLEESPLAAQAWSVDDENDDENDTNTQNNNISGIISVEEEEDDVVPKNTTIENENDDLPEAEYSHLDLSFDDITEFDQTVTGGPSSSSSSSVARMTTASAATASSNHPPSSPVKPHSSTATSTGVYYDDDTNNVALDEEDYILGTLIVRVVAARDLPPQKNDGGNNWLFQSSTNAPRSKRGGANPYASVRFGNTIQRTSQVFDAIDPIWPRGENMYLDVTHPPLSTTATATTTTQPEEDGNPSEVPPVAAAASSMSSSSSSSSTSPPPHPGDPPSKQDSKLPPASTTTSITKQQQSQSRSTESRRKPPRPVLTVALFHSNSKTLDDDPQKQLYNPPKKPTKNSSTSGDSDDVFLGMTAIDVTTLLTGKETAIDAWCPLTGGAPANGGSHHSRHHNNKKSSMPSVRLVCEYEASDAPPQPGDFVRFSGYCCAADLYPLNHETLYKVEEHPYDEHHSAPPDYSIEDDVTISYTSPEGWVCSHTAHRYMLLCEERQGIHPLQAYQGEFLTLQQRISRSPLVSTLQDVAVHRIPDEGLVSVGVAALQGAGSLFQKWMSHGVQSAVDDVLHVTNLDGHNDVTAEQSLAMDDDEMIIPDNNGTAPMDEEGNHDVSNESSPTAAQSDSQSSVANVPASPTKKSSSWQSLANMPCCPITGEPMDDPVVAADGHTYERKAIARWLQTSDKSPLTGSILPHKNLVPNYMLLSSLQEAQLKASASSAGTTRTTSPAKAKEPPTVLSNTNNVLNDDGQGIVLPSNSSTEDLVDHDLGSM